MYSLISQQPMIHMALWHHQQASASAAKQAHGQNDHGTSQKLQLYPHHWEQKMHQVTMPQKWYSIGISLEPPSI